MIDLLPKDDPIRRTIAPARALLNTVVRTRLVNKALGASLSPSEVEALPIDLVEAAVALVTNSEDEAPGADG